MTASIIRASLLHLGVLVACGWLLRQAFASPLGSFLSWPMYNSVSFFRVSLHDDVTGARVIPWHDQIHIDHGGGYTELERYLTFLGEVKGVTVSGHGVVGAWRLDETFEVRRSDVVRRSH